MVNIAIIVLQNQKRENVMIHYAAERKEAFSLSKVERIPPMPICKVVAHQFVVAVAHVDADVIEQFIVYQESKIEAALDIIHEHLGDEIHGKVFKMKSLADVKRTLALIGYLINVIEVI